MTTPTSKKNLGLAVFEKASANYNSERERHEREQSAEFPNILVRIHKVDFRSKMNTIKISYFI